MLPDRYSEPRLVARGGMGAVYCARDTVLNRLVAIKLLDERYAEDETVRKRFTREALAAARLSSDPSIVTIFDVGESDGQPFIVMEYLPGGSLHDVLKRSGAQSPARALDWLEQAARALDQAHSPGSSTATSSPRTCSSIATAGCMWPTSASRAPPASTRSPRRGR